MGRWECTTVKVKVKVTVKVKVKVTVKGALDFHEGVHKSPDFHERTIPRKVVRDGRVDCAAGKHTRAKVGAVGHEDGRVLGARHHRGALVVGAHVRCEQVAFEEVRPPEGYGGCEG